MRYDRLETLFHIDPPYLGGETDYGKGILERADFERIAGVPSEIKGWFLMSINDAPEIREWFVGYMIDEVKLNFSVSKKGGLGKVGELIIGAGA